MLRGSVLTIIEVGMTVLTLLCAIGWPLLGNGFFRAIENWGARSARKRALIVVFCGVSPICIRLCILPVKPIPQPSVHDEFSHLLAGETFASGRLANPVHPMWVHFETFHEDQQPTYMSMYPPAQGLTLAMGRVFFGHPWYGVCITMGLMCGAICWMLYGWLPPAWALLGGILVVLRIGVSSYWMNSYWGGGASAVGGALLLGALPRLLRRPRLTTALIIGLGLAILANTRPYEGIVLSVAASVPLIAWLLGSKRPSWRVALLHVLTPLTALLLVVACAMAYYNWRVFGSPATLPYQVNRATYAIAPVFLWNSPQPEPIYRHWMMRRFYVDWELPVYQAAHTFSGFFAAIGTKIGLLVMFFLGPSLIVPLIMLPRVIRDRRVKWLVLAAVVYLAGLSGNAFSVPHYLAPATALFYALVIQAMRHLRMWRLEGQPSGRFLVRVLPALCVVMFMLQVVRDVSSPTGDLPRTVVQRSLEALPGRQVALVRYAPDHDPMGEWVYNAADIDGSKVVWARDMSASDNAALLNYFSDRKAWLVEPDAIPPKVSPYVP